MKNSRWKKTIDQMPIDNEIVIVALGFNNYSLAYFDPQTKKWTPCEGDPDKLSNKKVFYWRP